MFLMKVIRKSDLHSLLKMKYSTLTAVKLSPHRLHEKKNSILWRILQKETVRQENRLLSTI